MYNKIKPSAQARLPVSRHPTPTPHPSTLPHTHPCGLQGHGHQMAVSACKHFLSTSVGSQLSRRGSYPGPIPWASNLTETSLSFLATPGSSAPHLKAGIQPGRQEAIAGRRKKGALGVQHTSGRVTQRALPLPNHSS